MACAGVIGRRVDKYDGQSIWVDGKEAFTLNNWLGGGAAGVVYEAVDVEQESTVAIKILNPCGYKLMPASVLHRCSVLRKGESPSVNKTFSIANVWWLVQRSTRQVVAAYEDPQRRQLRELSLPKCIELWGWDPLNTFYSDMSSSFGDEEMLEKILHSGQEVCVDGVHYTIPRVLPKFVKWLKAREAICREINNMAHLGNHANVVQLYEVLELVQDTKTTLFLVMELVTGGELFDRIKNGVGTQEALAKTYFAQLLSGIEYCHANGVCHRDLKPENLLLSDATEAAVLKIGDFGLSAVFAMSSEPSSPNFEEEKNRTETVFNAATTAQVRRLRSVVGSPHYVAPEIAQQGPQGYDGRKADSWSAGVILYALLGGSLPFTKDLTTCARYRRFEKWLASEYEPAMSEGRTPTYPTWLFSGNFSADAKDLIVTMLHTEPSKRVSISQAMRHRWLHGVSYTAGSVNRPSSANSNHNQTGSPRRRDSGNQSAATVVPTTPVRAPFEAAAALPVPVLARMPSPEVPANAHGDDAAPAAVVPVDEDLAPAIPAPTGGLVRRLFEDQDKAFAVRRSSNQIGSNQDAIPRPSLIYEQKVDDSWLQAKFANLRSSDQNPCK